MNKTNIVSLHGLDDEDEAYQEFLDTLKDDNANAIFLVEKEDGTVTVGCNFKTPKDLIASIYRLQELAQSIVRSGGEED